MSLLSEVRHAHLSEPPQFPPLVDALRDLLVSAGVDAYLVGGVVRDSLLGRSTDDVDLAVDGDPRRLGRQLADSLSGSFVTLDDVREIFRVVVEGPLGGLVDIVAAPQGIEADLKRRDFTVDAMAVRVSDLGDGRSPEVIDPHDGRADLKQRVVRGLSSGVFVEDPARLLRGPRLAAQLGFHIADDTATAIREYAYLVDRVAPERVRDELLKLVAAPGASASLHLLDDLGLLCRIVPELDRARNVTQPREHYWDVLDHCIETAGQVERLMEDRTADAVAAEAPWDESLGPHFAYGVSDGHTRLTLLKLAGLLHDIAKPATKTVEHSGRVRFLGHHTLGSEMAAQILGRLRLSGRGIDLVSRMVEHHLRPSQMAQGGELPSPRAIYRYYRDVGNAAVDTLFLNLADYLAARGPALESAEWSEHCRTVSHILQARQATASPANQPKLVDGHDIMREFRLEPGPRVGALLDLVREAQSSGEISTTDEAMELIGAAVRSGVHGA